jgi:Putative peptidoglycan binding domain
VTPGSAFPARLLVTFAVELERGSAASGVAPDGGQAVASPSSGGSSSSSSGIILLVVLGLLAVGMAGQSSDGDTDTDEATEFGFDDTGGDDTAGDDTASGFDDTGTCDDVVIVQSESGETDVPGSVTQVESTATAECGLAEGDDDDAVRALQEALVTCNGQDIAVDGEYGPETREAIERVQAANGLVADGTYGPPTRDAMLWPTTTSGTTTCVSDVQSSTASDSG